MNSLESNAKLHFPSIIGVANAQLKQIVALIDNYYSEWTTVKKDKETGLPKTYLDGTIKKRYIRPSLSQLKIIQIRIKTRVLEKIELPDNIHGGRKKRSNITNAKKHQGKKYILTTDLQEFYPSIKPSLIYQTFIDLGFNSQFAFYVMRLVTWKGELPQGTPTSAHIANIVFLKIDYLLIEFCRENNITYTRYVDDLTFSSQADFQHLIPNILQTIEDSDFVLSRRKTFYNNKQTVTGIRIFNNKIDAPERIILETETEKDLPDYFPKYYTRYRDQILKTNQKKK